MVDPVVLSGSSLNTFIECPKQWEYAYVRVLERPPSFKMAVGTAAHFAVEVAMKERIELGLYPPLSVWTDAFMQSWVEETKFSKPKNDKPEESRETNTQSGLNCVDFYRREIAPGITPLAVEMPIQFSINGHIWTGSIDLLEAIDDNPKRVAVRDHKFTGKRPDNPARYRWPMIGYAIGVRRAMDIVEEKIQLDYVIRNKQPVHFPVASGPATDDDILALAQEVENAMTLINRGTYPATGPQTGACNWCRYWDACPYYVGRRKKES
jgi:hypothetical protein